MRRLAAVALATLQMQCLPNPDADFTDFGARTLVDGGPATFNRSDGAAPGQGFDATYYASCLVSLAFCRVEKLLRFSSKVKYTPTAKGGKMALQIIPLKVTATTMADTETSGTNIVPPEAEVALDGTFTLPLGEVSVPGEANAISGRPIVISSGILRGQMVSAARFQAELDGTITQPITQPLNDSGDICLFVPLAPGGTIPTLTKEEFVGACR